MTNEQTRADFEEWAEDYYLKDGFTKQDCFFTREVHKRLTFAA